MEKGVKSKYKKCEELPFYCRKCPWQTPTWNNSHEGYTLGILQQGGPIKDEYIYRGTRSWRFFAKTGNSRQIPDEKLGTII